MEQLNLPALYCNRCHGWKKVSRFLFPEEVLVFCILFPEAEISSRTVGARRCACRLHPRKRKQNISPVRQIAQRFRLTIRDVPDGLLPARETKQEVDTQHNTTASSDRPTAKRPKQGPLQPIGGIKKTEVSPEVAGSFPTRRRVSYAWSEAKRATN